MEEEFLNLVKSLGLPGWVLIVVVLLLILDRVGVLKRASETLGQITGKAGEAIIESHQEAQEHKNRRDTMAFEAQIQDRAIERQTHSIYLEEIGAMLKQANTFIQEKVETGIQSIRAGQDRQSRQTDQVGTLLTQLNVNLTKLTDEVRDLRQAIEMHPGEDNG